MGNPIYNYNVDPWNSDAPDYIHAQSDYYSGSYDNITAPSTPNYPTSSATRYFLSLPGIIDVSDLTGSRPVLIRDVTGAVTLTRVTGTPGVNEFRVPPSISERRNTIELNAAQSSSVIGFDFYLIGTINHADDDNNYVIDGVVNPTGGIIIEKRDSSAVESFIAVKQKIIEIGDWDMDTLTFKTILHGISDFKKIRSVKVIVRNDNDTIYYPLLRFDSITPTTGASEGATTEFTTTTIKMGRRTGGIFDSFNFDSTSFNRGWLYITYEV